jgi:hypothetical protein
MPTQSKSKHRGKPKLRKTAVLQQRDHEIKPRSELERAEALARVVREARARAEAQATPEAQPEARPARETVRTRQPERARDSLGRLMVDALCRGCGVSDIIERTAGTKDTPAETLRRAQRLEGLLAEIGPRPNKDGGAGKSARTMQRTQTYLAQLIAGIQAELRSSSEQRAAGPRAGRHSRLAACRV